MLGDKLDSRANERFKAVGVDLLGKLNPAYEKKVWIAAVDIAAELHSPNEPAPVTRRYLLARRFMGSFKETMIGSAMVALMRVVGPRKTLERVQRSFRMGNNFSVTTLKQLAAQEYELWIDHVAHPEWYKGIIEAGLELAGAKEVQVVELSRKDAAVTFRVSWGS